MKLCETEPSFHESMSEPLSWLWIELCLWMSVEPKAGLSSLLSGPGPVAVPGSRVLSVL